MILIISSIILLIGLTCIIWSGEWTGVNWYTREKLLGWGIFTIFFSVICGFLLVGTAYGIKSKTFALNDFSYIKGKSNVLVEFPEGYNIGKYKVFDDADSYKNIDRVKEIWITKKYNSYGNQVVITYTVPNYSANQPESK